MTRVLTSRRWQIAWWGNLVVGAAVFFLCTDGYLPWTLQMASAVVMFFCGFLAAVLVETGTQ